ncbi:hypothetical protein [Kingella potus]|uniref:hypothetical protein n=1 Tax=Kingella potus TaxID=265175 RepID=UPI0011C01AC8|nr:hypothetical protein [Kingella potus]
MRRSHTRGLGFQTASASVWRKTHTPPGRHTLRRENGYAPHLDCTRPKEGGNGQTGRLKSGFQTACTRRICISSF